MRDQRTNGRRTWAPGTWSTDDYIREWAGRDPDNWNRDICIVPLQSLHGHWVARVGLGLKGQPVERVREGRDETMTAGVDCDVVPVA